MEGEWCACQQKEREKGMRTTKRGKRVEEVKKEPVTPNKVKGSF